MGSNVGSNGTMTDDNEPKMNWQDRARSQMRVGAGCELSAAALERLVRDFLDHHGDLAVAMGEVAQEIYPDAADNARSELHRHLLAITLLLEQVEAHEWHRLEVADRRDAY